MILIGQYDSPFVRRVGIALTLNGMNVVRLPDHPSLSAFTARLEALPVFQTIFQKFIPPVGPAAAS